MAYIHPQEVRSPRQHWTLFEVVIEGSAGTGAYALGLWGDKRRIGFRWNGNDENPIGNPQSRGLPTWTMLDPALHEAVVKLIPKEKQSIARAFLGLDGKYQAEDT